LLDRLALFTTERYQQSRDELIARQQRELLELSTPVVQLWNGVLALPLIGTLDSARTQVVMESLLEKIVDQRRRSPSSTSRRAYRRHAGGAASAQDRRRGAAHGRRLHHQRHPARRSRRPSCIWASTSRCRHEGTLADAFAIA
jgi:hypothetical protein